MMLAKYKRQSSNTLIQCCKPAQPQLPFLQIDPDRKKTHKISLKQTKSTKKAINLTIDHRHSAKQEKFVFQKICSPKITFKFLSPENKLNLKTNINAQNQDLSLYKSQKSIKTQLNFGFMSNQSKKTIVIPPKLIHRKQKSEIQMQLPDYQNKRIQKQDGQTFKTLKLKAGRNESEEKSTIIFQRQDIQLQTQKQSQIEFENSIVLKESSQDCKQNSEQRKSKQIQNSQKIEIEMRKWRKANTFTMSHQVFQKKQKEQLYVSSNTEKNLKQEHKKGSLFQKVRKIDTKFYEDDEQESSSDRSQVIDDYKSLMSKIQIKEMQDSAFIQI